MSARWDQAANLFVRWAPEERNIQEDRGPTSCAHVRAIAECRRPKYQIPRDFRRVIRLIDQPLPVMASFGEPGCGAILEHQAARAQLIAVSARRDPESNGTTCTRGQSSNSRRIGVRRGRRVR